MNFAINIRQADAVSLVEVTGRLTFFESKALRDAIQGLLKQGHKNILLNLTALVGASPTTFIAPPFLTTSK